MISAPILLTALAAAAASSVVDARATGFTRARRTAPASVSSGPIVDTALGKIEGTVSPYRNGSVNVFKGIPYAAPRQSGPRSVAAV